MGRKARAWSESGFYHVVARGNNRQRVFREEEDYSLFTRSWAYPPQKNPSGSCIRSSAATGSICAGNEENRRKAYRDYVTTSRPYDQVLHQKLTEVTIGA